MNLITLGEITQDIGRFVENGAGGCRPDLVAARVSDACERLLVKADLPYTTWKCRIRTDRGCFPLPREMESVIGANIDNNAAYVNPQMFEFMDAGPGEIRSWEGTGAKSLEDDGVHCTMYDVPAIEYRKSDSCNVANSEFEADGLNIMAFCTAAGDTGKLVSIGGVDKLNTPISADPEAFVPLESIQIVRWTDGVEGQLSDEIPKLPKSTKLYRSLTAFAKPKTASHISLYAVQPSTGRMWFLAKAHPDDTRPAWRRYKIRGQDCRAGSNVLVYGKAAALRLSRPTDVLPVQNRTAVKLMCMAIEHENKDQLSKSVELEAQAMRVLMEQKAEHDNRGHAANVIDMDLYCSNSAVNRFYSR